MRTVKSTLLGLTLGLMSFSVQTISKNDNIKIKEHSPLVWKAEMIDLGAIPQGFPKVIEFEFKNSSEAYVKIIDVRPSCGCTNAVYTKDSIAPNKTGFVKATFNAANLGQFTKTITVTTTAEETPKVVSFKGMVIGKS